MLEKAEGEREGGGGGRGGERKKQRQRQTEAARHIGTERETEPDSEFVRFLSGRGSISLNAVYYESNEPSFGNAKV